jgi:hypothetical protein
MRSVPRANGTSERAATIVAPPVLRGYSMRAVQRIRTTAIAACAVALSLAGSARAAAAQRTPASAPAEQQFLVIVGEKSPLTIVRREQLSQIFLKKEKALPGGREAMPVDIVGHGKVRIAFSNAVHKRSLVAIDNYWSQQIFNGKDVPPPAMARESDIVAFVRGNPDAVGYVSPTTELGPGIRVVRVE